MVSAYSWKSDYSTFSLYSLIRCNELFDYNDFVDESQ